MTTVLTFTEEETEEAKLAMSAGSMVSAAWEFDQNIRAILKYSETLTSDQYTLYEKVRETHRACWENAGVRFDL